MSEDFSFDAEPSGGVDYGEFTLRVKRWVLAGLADAAAAALPANAAVPALGCFQLRVSDGLLALSATDMERTVRAVSSAVAVEGVAENAYAQAYVPAKKLQAILKEAPDDDVTLTVKKNQATVTAGSGTWHLALPDGSSYPELVSLTELTFASFAREPFLAALRSVRHVVCRDAGRPPLTQAEVRSLDAEQQTVITASDGIRFARATVTGFPVLSEPLLIPNSVLDDLARLLAAGQGDTAQVAVSLKVVAFTVGPVTLSVARRSTPFPDMAKLLLEPAVAENTDTLSMAAPELLAAVRRVRITADGETSAILLEVVTGSGTVNVVSRDKLGNNASEPVPAVAHCAERVLCVNHVFLAEMLAAHPSQTCEFLLGKDHGKRRSVILLKADGITQVMVQMSPALVGY